MADNSSGTNGNSWTILTPEVKESGVESVGPLAEGLERPDHSEPAQPGTEQQDPENLSQRSDFTDGPTEHNSAPEAPQVAPLETNEVEAATHVSHVKDSTLSASPVENLTCLSSDAEQQDEREPPLNPDADSFSDSYTHICSGPASTLHPAASQEEEEEEEEEGLSAGGETLELRKKLREESSPEVEVSEEQEVKGDVLRRRKVPQPSPVDHRDEDEEEEGEEEPFTPPRREDDAGFSLNKCIFGAVILLGLGTVFFSGVLVDPDEEGDADVQELKDPHLKKEWLNLDPPGNTPAGVPPLEVLEQLAKESQKIAILQAQFQEQEGELKATQMQVEEGTRERVKRKELEVEIQKMRGELDKLPALQKELEQGNEKAKKDLEALPALQKELELLKARVTELTQSTTDGAQAVTPQSDSATPSAGPESELPSGQGKKEWKDKKSQEKVRKEKEWKEGKKDKEEGKPWKERGSEGKDPKKQKEREKKVHREEGKEYGAKGERKVGEDEKDEKEGKKSKKQENGKRWKDSEVNRDSKDEGKKRERKEDDKRWRDDKLKREFVEENGKEDKKHKKEKPWQLDVERWETKERKHSGEKVKSDDEKWNLRGSLKEGKGERDWERRRQAGSSDKKEWKEKSEKRKDGKERNEWDTEERSRPKGGGKAHKKEPWKGEEKDHHRGGNHGKKDRKERDEWDAENENERSSKSERKAHKKDSWKGEKNPNREGNGGKKSWKERNEWDPENEGMERNEKKKKDWKERNEWDPENEGMDRNEKKKKDWKERNEWDAENERSPKRERNAHKKDSWKEEKEGNGGKKEWKDRADKHSSGKEREWSKNEEKAEFRKQRKDDHEKNEEKWSKKDKLRNPSPDKDPHHLYSDQQQSQDHTHAGDYWAEQRERIRHFRGSTEGCDGVTACAHAEGLTPVAQRDFEAFLSTYLNKLQAPENQASKKEELNKLISEFFTNGVFVHDQIPFSEFVEDVADILEDMAEEEEDKGVEDEMEEFKREAMEKFVLSDRGGNEEKRRESGRRRVSG